MGWSQNSPRSPGPSGYRDAGDPTCLTRKGDTPGVLGDNDRATPSTCGSLRFPAGLKRDVIASATSFLIKEEGGIIAHPYWPRAQSGITWGVGWDAGQHSEEQLRKTWSELPVDVLDRLAKVAKLQGEEAKKKLSEVKDLSINEKISRKVFEESLQQFYESMTNIFPGSTSLPTGVQVALISLVFNRGSSLGGGKDLHNAEIGWKRNPGTQQKKPTNTRLELRRIRDSVRKRDILSIYYEFHYMKRVWWGQDIEKGMTHRKEKEAALIYPYVREHVQVREEFKNEYGLSPDLVDYHY